MRGRKVLIALAAVLALAGGYAVWWKAQVKKAPSFAKGGAWGIVETPGPGTAPPGGLQSPGGPALGPSPGVSPGTGSPIPASPGRSPGGKVGPSPSPARTWAAGEVYAEPRVGVWKFRASGREQVKLRAFSPCGWDITSVTLAINEEKGEYVFDWTLHQNHKERNIWQYSPTKALLTFVGAEVTCSLAPPQTDQATYTPPVERFRFPLVVGASWGGKSQAGNRTEEWTVKVLRKERITVPAGTFDAYVVEQDTTFSGNQTGSREDTFWYVPALGVWVKEVAKTTASQGGSTFSSSYTIELESYPR